MKKIIILARISTAPQDIESQTKDLIKEAERLGYSKDRQIVIETVESAIKLSEEERLGLRKMKHYIETDKDVDCVICWEPSRLARQQKILYSIRDYLIEHKIQLYILNPYVRLLTDDRTQVDSTANIVFSLFATISENEMMIKKERFLRAKNEMKEKRQKFAGAIIFGYMKNSEKKCVPDPYKSKIIADLFEHYANTDSSLYETYCYASGKYPVLFPMIEYIKAQHKIRHFFDVEIYYKGNWCYDPIISEEIWNKVHEKMSKAKCRARYKNERKLLCRGKIYCGHCGRMMTGSGGNTKAYCCVTDKLHNLQINFDAADWIMWEETRTIVNINASIDSSKKTTEIKTLLNEKKTLIKQYEANITDINNKKDKLVDLYIKGTINETMLNKKNDELSKEESVYSNYIKKLNTEIRSLGNILEETQKDLIRERSIIVDNIEDFETRQEFVRRYIQKMIINKVEDEYRTLEITFEYNHPVISPRSKYLYVYKNQNNNKIYRINEDGTKDWIK